MDSERHIDRTVALVLAAALVLNFPMLGLVDAQSTIAGLPALYVYLFAVWIALIGATALLMERPPQRPPEDTASGPANPAGDA